MSDATRSDTSLSAEERAAIDDLWERRLTASHYEVLGVSRSADRKAIRDAYFALSRRFHPDVFFNRDLGAYRSRVDEVFRILTRAYDVLSNAKQRAGYDLHLSSLDSFRPGAPSVPPAPPTPTRVEAPPPAPPPASPPSTAGAVVPPPMRSSSPNTPVAQAPTGSQTIDPAVRQRALETMRRKLSSVIPNAGRGASAPTAPVVPIQPPVRPDERDSKLGRLIGEAEEAQKRGDFESALDLFRAASQIARDDDSVRARMEAVDQLVKAQKTGEYIEKARDAMREGKADLAASLWEKAWEGRPTDAALLVNAAEVMAKYGSNPGRAKDLAQRALAVDPKAVKAQVVLAQVFAGAGLKASARAAVEAIERLDPQNPQIKELREKIGPLTLAEQLGLRGR